MKCDAFPAVSWRSAYHAFYLLVGVAKTFSEHIGNIFSGKIRTSHSSSLSIKSSYLSSFLYTACSIFSSQVTASYNNSAFVAFSFHNTSSSRWLVATKGKTSTGSRPADIYHSPDHLSFSIVPVWDPLMVAFLSSLWNCILVNICLVGPFPSLISSIIFPKDVATCIILCTFMVL